MPLSLCERMFSHAYEHLHVRTHNSNRHSSPLTRVRKTASRASATNGEANNAPNDKTNMWLVRSSFASPLARMCKCGIRCCLQHAALLSMDSLSVIAVHITLVMLYSQRWKPTKFGSPCAVAATVWHMFAASSKRRHIFKKNVRSLLSSGAVYRGCFIF